MSIPKRGKSSATTYSQDRVVPLIERHFVQGDLDTAARRGRSGPGSGQRLQLRLQMTKPGLLETGQDLCLELVDFFGCRSSDIVLH